jgi:hypothetical protein
MVLLTCTSLMAQQTTTAVTVYREFKPAKVLLASGKSTKVALANIFLKNSTLLYKHGTETMQAKTSTIQRVEFDDRTYYRIDSLLAYQVDTIGSDALFRTERIDFEAFNQERINNVEITSLSLGEVMQYTTRDIDSEQDIHFPLESLFYFRIGGKYILAQERSVARALNKEKRRMMKSAMLDPAFSWTSEQSLMKMLEMIR